MVENLGGSIGRNALTNTLFIIPGYIYIEYELIDRSKKVAGTAERGEIEGPDNTQRHSHLGMPQHEALVW
jgi:hypothetical protein